MKKLELSLHLRRTAHNFCGRGERVKPTTGVKSNSSSETPGGEVKRKCWRRAVKNKNSSILARLSPGHALRPAQSSAWDSLIIIIFLFATADILQMEAENI